MDVYMYQAALLCSDCGEHVVKELTAEGLKPASDMEDSNKFPVGLYPNGGGEADCPQSCDHCHVFLENPLTGDGATYTRDAFREYVETGRGKLDVLQEWRRFYDYAFDDFAEITLPLMEEERPLTAAQRKRLEELE